MDQLSSEQELRDKLSLLLSNKELANYSQILSLSTELVKFDKDNVRFTVDAGV